MTGKVSVFSVSLPGGKVTTYTKNDLAKGLEVALVARRVLILDVKLTKFRSRRLESLYTLDASYSAAFRSNRALNAALNEIQRSTINKKVAQELLKTSSFKGQTTLGVTMGAAKAEGEGQYTRGIGTACV